MRTQIRVEARISVQVFLQIHIHRHIYYLFILFCSVLFLLLPLGTEVHRFTRSDLIQQGVSFQGIIQRGQIRVVLAECWGGRFASLHTIFGRFWDQETSLILVACDGRFTPYSSICWAWSQLNSLAMHLQMGFQSPNNCRMNSPAGRGVGLGERLCSQGRRT